jgi:hypothetical protein
VRVPGMTHNKFMKIVTTIVLTLIAALTMFAVDIKTGDDVVAAMYKKYQGKWYKTLTFVQKTIHHNPDGTSTSETWYEALNAPGSLRIDIDPADKGNGILFTNGQIYQFKDGKAQGTGGRPFVHPLLVLGFDVYTQSVEKTISQLKGLGIDMTIVHEDKWNGQDVYVVGAKQGDVTTPQFWVTKKEMLFVRLIQQAGRDRKSVAETQFNKYVKAKGGWVAAEVKFYVDGKPTTSEEYTDIQADIKLDPDLWNSDKWMTVQRNYWIIKK